MDGFGRRILPLIIAVAAVVPFLSEPSTAAQAWIELGSINVEHGLSCPNAGDGQTAPKMIDGRDCRMNDPDATVKSLYMYFDADPDVIGHPVRPAYVTVDYFDKGVGTLSIQYDSRDTSAAGDGVYKNGSEELLLDSGRWRSVIFELPDPLFDGRQDNGADFRLVSTGNLQIAKVTLDTSKPADYDSRVSAPDDRIKSRLSGLHLADGVRIIATGLRDYPSRDAETIYAHLRHVAPLLKAMGATSVVTHVRWDVAELGRGSWNWDFYDGILRILERSGLKWTPVFSAGPTFHAPGWFTGSDQSLPAVCLEHPNEIDGESIWNPNLSKWITEFVSQFALRYNYSSSIESIGIDLQDGPHKGLWCGDKAAKADFRRFVKDKYSKIARLNSAWNTGYKGFDEISPFASAGRPSAAAGGDEAEWYGGRMTRLADIWLENVREALPRLPLYVRTEVDSQGQSECDLAGLARVAANYEAGLWTRYTAKDRGEALAATRLAASVAHFYGPDLILETDGVNQGAPDICRVFNCVSSAANTVCLGEQDFLEAARNTELWKRCLGSLKPEQAVVSTAVFCASPADQASEDLPDKLSTLRDGLDFHVIDERMILDGVLEEFKALVWLSGDTISERAAAALTGWVKQGGLLLADSRAHLRTDKGRDIFQGLMPQPGREMTSKIVGTGAGLRMNLNWTDRSGVVKDVSRVLNGLTARTGRSIAPDGEVDHVYVTDLGDRLLIFNAGTTAVEREMEVAVGRKLQVKVPEASVIEVPLRSDEKTAEREVISDN